MKSIHKDIIENFNSEFDYYGASCIAAEYCHFKKTPYTDRRMIWQHGWIPEFCNIHPYIVIPSADCDNRDNINLVAREDQKTFLMKHGYKNVQAIGLPVIYTKQLYRERKPGTLLVMPVHSLYCTTHEHWNFSDYAKSINDLKSDFQEIVICIHPSCMKKGYWIKEFEMYNFKIIEGCDIYDRNSLYRMQELLTSFEYITTNGFGSHIAYAAYFGAKVSIYGDFAESKKEDFATDPLYISFPEILEDTIELFSRKSIEHYLGELFVYPKSAIQRIDWGKEQMGHNNKITPQEFRKLAGWDMLHLFKTTSHRLGRRAYHKVKANLFRF
jgi:hypothetical protein